MTIDNIIAGKELNIPQARSLKNQKIGKSKTRSRVLLAIAVPILSLGLGFGLKKGFDNYVFRQVYNQALEQYGDSNSDRFVSTEENKELFNNIFYKTGITFSSEGAKYSDGKQVPTSELTGIIKNYIDNPLRE